KTARIVKKPMRSYPIVAGCDKPFRVERQRYAGKNQHTDEDGENEMVQLLNDVIFAEVGIFGWPPERITDPLHQIPEISGFKPHRPGPPLRPREADMQKHTNDKQPG